MTWGLVLQQLDTPIAPRKVSASEYHRNYSVRTEPMTEKACSHCGEVLPIAAFGSPVAYTKAGFPTYKGPCLACRKIERDARKAEGTQFPSHQRPRNRKKNQEKCGAPVRLTQIKEKVCKGCNCLLPVSEFRQSGFTKAGLFQYRSRCKPCDAVQRKSYRK